MRIWSVHPQYLDAAGLVALWRETLLARAVLNGQTRGYHNHPQLDRFKAARDPVAMIDRYLAAVHTEAESRGYNFDISKFAKRRAATPIVVTSGQVAFELQHLKRKLRARHPMGYRALLRIKEPAAHPLFVIKPGDIADWERA